MRTKQIAGRVSEHRVEQDGQDHEPETGAAMSRELIDVQLETYK